MAWKTEVPTEGGFYWAKLSTRDSLSDVVIEVGGFLRGGKLGFSMPGDDNIYNLDDVVQFWYPVLKAPRLNARMTVIQLAPASPIKNMGLSWAVVTADTAELVAAFETEEHARLFWEGTA